MSGVNVTCNVRNKNRNDLCESKFEGTLTDLLSESSKSIVGEIINKIFENAIEIATSKTELRGDDNIGVESNDYKLSSNPYEIVKSSPDIQEIIIGLSSVNVENINKIPEEPVSLDIEMKRLLNEMMSPPYEIVNYDALPRKDGVGDQPIESCEILQNMHDMDKNQENDIPKIVEKKSRITDLVMNTKQILSNLLDDEAKKKQEEWEVSIEEEVQVIELQEDGLNSTSIEICNDELNAPIVKSQENKEDASQIDRTVDAKTNKNVKHRKKIWNFMLKAFGISKKVGMASK